MLINDLSLGVDTGELVSLVGPNGAGKSTTLRAITGLVAWEREIKRRSTDGRYPCRRHGDLRRANGSIRSRPMKSSEMGLDPLPRTAKALPGDDASWKICWPGPTCKKTRKETEENLRQGLSSCFPVLKERSHQISGTLSGGEQQMLAIGRALMSEPQAAVHRRTLHGAGPHHAGRSVSTRSRRSRPGDHRAPGRAGGQHGLQDDRSATTSSLPARSSPKAPAKICSRTRSSARPIWGCSGLYSKLMF